MDRYYERHERKERLQNSAHLKEAERQGRQKLAQKIESFTFGVCFYCAGSFALAWIAGKLFG